MGYLIHLRFALFPALMLASLVALRTGGAWTWMPALILMSAYVFLDELGGRFDRVPTGSAPRFHLGLVLIVVLATPLISLSLAALVGSSGSPMHALAAHGPSSGLSLAGAVISAGLLLGTATTSAHELFHRREGWAWYGAQLALAQLFYTPLALEHVFGHHRNVGLATDVTTAPRGRSIWRRLPLLVAGTYAGAARIEAARLARQGSGWASPRNRFLQGLVFQSVMVAAIGLLGGAGGLIGYALAAAVAVIFVEVAQYVSHYGLVRVPGQPVHPRHSWNAPRFLSTSVMINVQRHSDHHRIATRPYWRLEVLDDAPVYPVGMGVMAMVALWPPLFFRVIAPLLDDWDARLASPGERALVSGDTAPPVSTGSAVPES